MFNTVFCLQTHIIRSSGQSRRGCLPSWWLCSSDFGNGKKKVGNNLKNMNFVYFSVRLSKNVTRLDVAEYLQVK